MHVSKMSKSLKKNKIKGFKKFYFQVKHNNKQSRSFVCFIDMYSSF